MSMSNKSYKTLTNPKYLKRKVRVGDSIGILRTNNESVKEILMIFSNKGKSFYIHFLDGDNWKEREGWKNNKFIDRYDFETSFELFSISPYKDCVFQWADEYFLISPYDLTLKINQFLENKDFTMTRLVYKTIQADFNTIARLSHIVRDKKLIKRGCSYFIEPSEMK